MNTFGGETPPALPREHEEGCGSCLALGVACTRFGCGALGPRREVTPWSRFKKSGEGPYRGLAGREWPLMVMILTDSQCQRPAHFYKVKATA